MPRHLPREEVQNRWYSEPLKLLFYGSKVFQRNSKGYPVLHKSHQKLISRYMRLKNQPWIVLSSVGKLFEDSTGHDHTLSTSTKTSSLTSSQDAFPPLKSENRQTSSTPTQDPTPHLSYIRYLQRNQPPRSTIERFGFGYQDFLQAPLQPLTDNLESITYEVFERDPVKYDSYERAIRAALMDWSTFKRPTSGPEGRVVVAVVGAGRGPLVSRALRAADDTGVSIDMWAVEKNTNAYVLLQRHNKNEWKNRVSVVKSDMRCWQGPIHMPLPPTSRTSSTSPAFTESLNSTEMSSSAGKVDIFISELLGSFGDNELSPECLDGISDLMAPEGVSIPTSYTAHIIPLSAPRIHTDILARTISDPEAPMTPYVVMLHAVDFLSTISVTRQDGGLVPNVQECWEFSHPTPTSIIYQAERRRSGQPTGRGGEGLAGGDGWNEHNSRYCRLKFYCQNRGVCNGLAGYFETVLYESMSNVNVAKIELSTNPVTMERKSRDMISWFPIFFPLKVCPHTFHSQETPVSRRPTKMLTTFLLRLPSTSRITQCWPSPSGDRPMIGRCGTSGLWKLSWTWEMGTT
jgi:protein arginine N-methyltransferase 5